MRRASVCSVPDRLRPLWDFGDLEASENRLRVQLERETTDGGRAEVLTQLARVEGLRNEFDACQRLLQEAEALAGASQVAKVRIDLERGRKLRSSGDGQAAAPLFESAFARACEHGEYFLAGDAAHMVAIAVPEKMLEWTERGLELAESEPDASYWAPAQQPRLAPPRERRLRRGPRGLRTRACGAGT